MASEECCKPAPPAEHADEGAFGSIGGLKAYLHKPASTTKAIILASDVFGCDSPLVKKLADKVAAAGYYAVVPDFFNGDPYVPLDPANPFANFGTWIAIHHPDASIAAAKTVIKELKEQGFESVGISGFCWGARVAVMIGKEESIVKAIVLCHPSLTTAENIEDLKVATAILGSELDNFTPPPVLDGFKKTLDAKPFPSFVKLFPGQTHGWTIRYDVNIPHQVKGAEEAHADMLEFYSKNL